MVDRDYTIVLSREQSGGEWAWVATVPELPGCAATEATPEAALQHIKVSIADYIEDQVTDGLEIPMPSSQPSGRFTIRVPRWVHSRLKRQADSEGISLNHYVTSILSYWVSRGQQPIEERRPSKDMPVAAQPSFRVSEDRVKQYLLPAGTTLPAEHLYMRYYCYRMPELTEKDGRTKDSSAEGPGVQRDREGVVEDG